MSGEDAPVCTITGHRGISTEGQGERMPFFRGAQTRDARCLDQGMQKWEVREIPASPSRKTIGMPEPLERVIP